MGTISNAANVNLEQQFTADINRLPGYGLSSRGLARIGPDFS
jgi:hypothetical protein